MKVSLEPEINLEQIDQNLDHKVGKRMLTISDHLWRS